MTFAYLKRQQNMRTLILFCLLALCGLTGCHETVPRGPVSGAFYSENLVQAYVDADDINGHYMPDVNTILINVDGDLINDHNGNEYFALAEQYGDTHYNRYIVPYTHVAIVNELDGIEIISNQDFGDIPAGETLASVVRFYGVSVLKYIQSDYAEVFDWENYLAEGFSDRCDYEFLGSWDGNYPINKMLADVMAQDLVLLSRKFLLKFTDTPPVKSHTMTVTLRDGTQTFSTTVEVDSSSGSDSLKKRTRPSSV